MDCPGHLPITRRILVAGAAATATVTTAGGADAQPAPVTNSATSSGTPAMSRVSLRVNGQAHALAGELVSTNYFAVLGASPALGRAFAANEDGRAGDIAAIAGVEQADIGDTICALEQTEALPRIEVDPPAVNMSFLVNTSPMAGREGKVLLSRELLDRLKREERRNPAIRVEQTDSPDTFMVSGRGELQLAVIVEAIRREGFEVAVGKPKAVLVGAQPFLGLLNNHRTTSDALVSLQLTALLGNDLSSIPLEMLEQALEPKAD